MPVNTPQLDVPVYQPKDMAVPPQPTGMPSQVLPAQAGFVPKSGAAAYVANNLLQGWLKGREVAQQRALVKAQNQMQGADYAYQTLAQNYNDLLRAGKSENDPEVQKAKQAANSAWQAKLGVMSQYAMPQDQKGQKKGVKQKAEGFLGQVFGKSGIEPHMIPQASLQILKNSQPPGLGLTPQDRMAMTEQKEAETRMGLEKTQAAEAELKYKREQQEDADTTKFLQIGALKPDQRTPEQREWWAAQERLQDAKTRLSDPKKAVVDEATRALLDHKELTPDQRATLYAAGVLQGPHTEITHEGAIEYATTFSPDGKILSKEKVGREFHEDQAAAFLREIQGQHNMLYDEIAQAQGLPAGGKRDNPIVWRQVTIEESKNPLQMEAVLGGGDPLQKEQDDLLVDSVLRGMQSEAGTGEDGERKKAQWSNFQVTPPNNDDTGYYRLRNPKALPDGTFAGGMDEKALAAEHAAFANRFRYEVAKKRPKWTPQQIDDFMRRVTPPQDTQQGTQQRQGAQQQPSGTEMQAPPPAASSGTAHKVLDATGRAIAGAANAYWSAEKRIWSPGPWDQAAADYIFGKPQAPSQGPGPDGVYGTPGPGKKKYLLRQSHEQWKDAKPAWGTAQDVQEWQNAGFLVRDADSATTN